MHLQLYINKSSLNRNVGLLRLTPLYKEDSTYICQQLGYYTFKENSMEQAIVTLIQTLDGQICCYSFLIANPMLTVLTQPCEGQDSSPEL